MKLFVDRSASHNPETGKNQAGFAVVTSFEIKLAQPLPANFSAQAAELKVLTEAYKLASGKTANNNL